MQESMRVGILKRRGGADISKVVESHEGRCCECESSRGTLESLDNWMKKHFLTKPSPLG